MPGQFTKLVRQYEGAIIGAWVDEMYADKRTDLPALLSYGQLIDHLPEVLEELALLIDQNASEHEITDTTRRLRAHAQIRFQQGALIDEVARELMIFRKVFEDFLWREGLSANERELWKLRDALRLVSRFADEMISQTLVIYAASLRPPLETRASVWPPPRRRRTDFPQRKESS
jgi:hypothetical protein